VKCELVGINLCPNGFGKFSLILIDRMFASFRKRPTRSDTSVMTNGSGLNAVPRRMRGAAVMDGQK
jgi:hypothetical protein